MQTIKVGVLGMNPPQILQWDKHNLEGKVVVADMVETAEHYIPEMRAKGADLVIIAAHSGITGTPQEPLMENAAIYLAQVKGLDALLLGHAHKAFPGEYPDIEKVDNKTGKIAGVPAVMPGVTGNHLGIIDLKLTYQDGRWQVADSHSELRKVKALPSGEEDQGVVNLIQTVHDETIEWLSLPIGKLTAPIHSFFSVAQDDASIQIVSDAQLWHVEQVKADCLKQNGLNCGLKEDLPVLSAAAPFRGGRNGPNDYTWVQAGDISGLFEASAGLRALAPGGGEFGDLVGFGYWLVADEDTQRFRKIHRGPEEARRARADPLEKFRDFSRLVVGRVAEANDEDRGAGDLGWAPHVESLRQILGLDVPQ